MSRIRVKAIVVKGHGVASGKSLDPRFQGGTIAMQKPVFQALGLDLGEYYSGTLNLSIAPLEYKIKRAKYTFKNVLWSETAPPEDFSFFDCRILYGETQAAADGLIYFPHPETKPQHFQPAGVLEVLTRYIEDLRYGTELLIELNDEQLAVSNPS